MTRLDDHLQARAPSLHQRRDGRSLFVWGDVGQWLVVDAEAAFLLERFAARRRVKDVLAEFSRKVGKPLEAIVPDALPVIDSLVQRGILGSPPQSRSWPEEPLRVSNLTYNITNRCNLRCPWCYNPSETSDEIPIAALLAWLHAGLKSLDPETAFLILGGEPFLDQPRLLDVVRGVRQRLTGELLVSTNGTLLSDATIPVLAATATTVQVSLDSPSPNQHDAARGRGVFDRAVANAKRLVDAGVHTLLSMVMTRRSEDDFEAYFDLATQIGAREVRFIPLRRIGQGVVHADQTPDLHACFQGLVKLLQRRPGLSRLLGRDFFSILMAVCRFSHLRDNCGIARRCLFVDADGTIFPCPNHRGPQYHCGNVLTTPLASVLADSPVLQSLRERYRLARLPACRQCAFRFWCAGDCRAEALATTGTPDAPSPYCEPLKQVMTEMLWLMADGWQGLAGRDSAIRPFALV